MNQSGIAENWSSITTIKRSKAIEQNLKNLGTKISNNKKIKEINDKITETLFATQAKMDKLSNFSSTGTSKVPQKSDTYLKYKKQSKEDLKNFSGLIKQIKKPSDYPSFGGMGVGKMSQPSGPLEEVQLLRKDASVKPYKRKKMSEETYPETKGSLATYSKKQKKSLINK